MFADNRSGVEVQMQKVTQARLASDLTIGHRRWSLRPTASPAGQQVRAKSDHSHTRSGHCLFAMSGLQEPCSATGLVCNVNCK